MAAIFRYDTPAVQRLLDSGVSPNTWQDEIGPEEVPESALMLAADVGDKRIVQMLLEHGAGINEGDAWGMTALDYADDSHHADVAQFLKAQGGKSILESTGGISIP